MGVISLVFGWHQVARHLCQAPVPPLAHGQITVLVGQAKNAGSYLRSHHCSGFPPSVAILRSSEWWGRSRLGVGAGRGARNRQAQPAQPCAAEPGSPQCSTARWPARRRRSRQSTLPLPAPCSPLAAAPASRAKTGAAAPGTAALAPGRSLLQPGTSKGWHEGRGRPGHQWVFFQCAGEWVVVSICVCVW